MILTIRTIWKIPDTFPVPSIFTDLYHYFTLDVLAARNSLAGILMLLFLQDLEYFKPESDIMGNRLRLDNFTGR
jgi:hypothetical protein